MQCIGVDPEGNKRMREAWSLKLKHGDTVHVLNENTGGCEKWQFSHYTQAGARLWKKVDQRHYNRLVNWDRGDRLMTAREDMLTHLLMWVIQRKAKAQVVVDECQLQIAQIIEQIQGGDTL